jgi:hypothetical protein
MRGVTFVTAPTIALALWSSAPAPKIKRALCALDFPEGRKSSTMLEGLDLATNPMFVAIGHKSLYFQQLSPMHRSWVSTRSSSTVLFRIDILKRSMIVGKTKSF